MARDPEAKICNPGTQAVADSRNLNRPMLVLSPAEQEEAPREKEMCRTVLAIATVFVITTSALTARPATAADFAAIADADTDS